MKSIIWFLLCLCGFSIFSGSVNATVVNGSTGQIITLSPGWNTFSTPKVLDSITFQSGGTGLYFYSLTSTGWQAIVPTKDTVKPLEGFMINNTNSNTSNINLTYKSNLSPMEMIFQKQLHAGWNILGITTINNPFGSIGSNITMSLDFTRSSEGGLNYTNKVASTYYSKVGFPIISNLLGGESYGIFMQTPMLYAGVQNQTIGPDYTPTTIIASLAVAGGTITAGKTNQLFTRVNISAGEQDIITNGFTLTRSGSVEFTERLQNVKVYKNGVSVGTVSISADKITVSGLTDILTSGNTQTYELKADILVDMNNSLGIKIDSITDISATEVATGYDTSIVLGNASIDIIFSPIELTFTKTSTGDLIVTPGTNNIKLFNGKIQSNTPVSIRRLSITPDITGGSGILAFVNDQLVVKYNGSEIGTLTSLSGTQVLVVSFVLDSANLAVITIEGSTKNNTNIAPSSSQFTVVLTEVRDSSNNPIVNLGAGSSLIGDKVTVQNAEVEIKNATVAAPSTTRLYSSAEQEIGRFALTSRNEVARLQSIALTASTTNGTIQQIANSTSSAKLVDVATGLEVSATVTISGNNITFSSMNDTIGKDVTKNYKVVLGVSSVDSYYGMTLNLLVSTGSISVVRDSNSVNITPTGSTITKSYTVGTVAPTVLVTAINENTFKVRVTNPDSNTGITLTSTKFDFKTALPGSTTYNAVACLRDLGSTKTCDGTAGVSTATGAIPALAQDIAVGGLTTNMTADKNGGYVEFEVYITSANLLPTGGQLQVALTKLNYTISAAPDSETYVGTAGASASFTK